MNKIIKKYLSITLLCILSIVLPTSTFSPITSWWSKGQTKSILKNMAENPNDQSQNKALLENLEKLSTQDKQEVLNEWMNVRSKNMQDMVNLIKADSSMDKLEKDTAIQEKKEQFRQEVDGMKDEMKPSLKDHEVLITALNAKKQLQFKVVDMTKINPTQPLTQQYDALARAEDLKVGLDALTKIVANFYADKVTLDLSKPVDAQILKEIPNWNNFNKELQSNVLNKLATKIPEESVMKKAAAKQQQAHEIREQQEADAQQELQKLDKLTQEAATIKKQQDADQARRNEEKQRALQAKQKLQAQARQEQQRREKLAKEAAALKKQRAEQQAKQNAEIQRTQEAHAKQDAQTRQELQRLEKLTQKTKLLKKQQELEQERQHAEKQQEQLTKEKLATQAQRELQKLEKLAKEAATIKKHLEQKQAE
ncbi:MAG: hypothetical protein WC747_04750 [Candidatus Babeliales bacterium]